MPNYLDGYLLTVPSKKLAACRARGTKAGEPMVFQGIVSKWRAHRDRANRMRYGGFGVFVDL